MTMTIMATTNTANKRHCNYGGDDDTSENHLLHTSLLRGNLAVTTHDVDIRRQEDMSTIGLAGALSNLISIETDYILQIAEVSSNSATTYSTESFSNKGGITTASAATSSAGAISTKSVQFDKDCKCGTSNSSGYDDDDDDPTIAEPKMETYHCSKRYVDLRNLAIALQSDAEDIVKYYATTTKEKTKSKDSKGVVSATTTALYGTLEKWAFHKPIEAVQFLTNTESNSSHLASTLDSISKNSGGNQDNQASISARRRMSDILHKGSPFYVRHVLLGVDRFYEAIFSEKRQFRKKTNLAYVTKVAERRRFIIDMAFSQLMQELSRAELGRHHYSSNSGSSISMPVPLLDRLIQTLEKFLLTDVLLEGVEGGGAHLRSKEARGKPHSPQDEKINSSLVRPMSTSRRASVVDRTEEMRMLHQEVATSNLVLSSDSLSDDDDKETNFNTTTNDMKMPAGDFAHVWGVLPDHPTDFAVLVGLGSLFFKFLEGRVISVPLDIMFAFGIVCGLVGYQMAQLSMSADHLPRLRDGLSDDGVAPSAAGAYDNAVQYHYGPSSGDETTFPRPGLRSTVLTPSTASTSDSISVMSQHNPKSLRLIRKSISSVRAFVLGDDDKSILAPGAKTFPQFPHGAAIGSHLNCWSSPPSNKFHVRGSNYLKDKEKVPSEQYLLPCRGCDLFLTDTAPTNVGRNRSILGGELRDMPTFIINYRLPWGVFLSYHEIPNMFLPFLRRGHGYGDLTTPLPSMANMSSGERTLCNFLLSSAEEKNQVFKIIPMVVEGPWVVKRVVGGKPAIIGKKLPITYVYQPPEEQPDGFLAEYLEADLDIVSSAAARNILAVVRSYTQVLTIDLGFVVQGNSEEELPEQMMLGLRLHGLDPITAELLPTFENGTTMLDLDNEE